MKRPFVSACMLLGCLVAPWVQAGCNVVDVSRADAKAVLREWLGCGSAFRQSEIEEYVDDFGFVGSTWDDGRGWENWCDEKLPLGKTFAAIKLLKDGWNLRVKDPKHRHVLTTGVYKFAKDNIDNFEFACKAEDVGADKGATGYTAWGLFTDDTYLFKSGVNVHVTEIAQTIVHEARHSDLPLFDDGHVDCTKGDKREDACDEALNDGGPTAYGIAWKINFAYHGKEPGGQSRLTACNTANMDIQFRINRTEHLRCNPELIGILLPTPKCPDSRPSGTLIAESSSAHHWARTKFSSKATLSGKTSTTCTYSGKVTTNYSTAAGSGSSTYDGSHSWPITDFNDTYDDVLPSYKY